MLIDVYVISILVNSRKLVVKFLKKYFFIFRERRKEGERGRETTMCDTNIDWLPLAHPNGGHGPQPRHVP